MENVMLEAFKSLIADPVIRTIIAGDLGCILPLAGCFSALGSGLRLVGTASSRRLKRAKNQKNGEEMEEIRPKKCEPRELTKDQLAEPGEAARQS